MVSDLDKRVLTSVSSSRHKTIEQIILDIPEQSPSYLRKKVKQLESKGYLTSTRLLWGRNSYPKVYSVTSAGEKKIKQGNWGVLYDLYITKWVQQCKGVRQPPQVDKGGVNKALIEAYARTGKGVKILLVHRPDETFNDLCNRISEADKLEGVYNISIITHDAKINDLLAMYNNDSRYQGELVM